ncbi:MULTISPECIES: subclass B3 metallo-beta-lactamase [unclassified Sphingomonas]|uniref:subclass B3 metallo-beta-lactamase n=1 Tax=unclassified Sphingomonas TaxID=196159 RepID=UPI000FF721E3|nr:MULTISPECIES: subclass B3 metallo-beta-lactamase [unclassified Sphingomonas]RKE49970.1 metallo-beta-lactamase class B [Sphingomonas sp. PP-CC-1A-547]TCM08301.1 metallo-beta-lactamase class B [Sphingomonas sp. PP-CC-3G-468]
MASHTAPSVRLRLPPPPGGGGSLSFRVRLLMGALAIVASAPLLLGAADPPAWTRPLAPFLIAGRITYVGSEGIAAYLIKTSAGAILIDGTLAENAGMIERNIANAGVRPRDVKLILVTHAHFDHAAGVAVLKRATGARVVAGARDVRALETGTPPGETSYGVIRFPPVHVDRGVRDGDKVTLGNVTLTARATPGHTPGCTTWMMQIPAKPRPLDVVFPCSVSVAGNRLIGNRAYPGIVADYRRSIAMLGTLHADIVLPSHPELADVIVRGQRRKAGGTTAFVDPTLLPKIVKKAKVAFDADLAKQAR